MAGGSVRAGGPTRAGQGRAGGAHRLAPGESRARRRWRGARAGLALTLAAAVAALLFLAYLRESWTVPAASDGAAQALQARDMLAGNWLLHGWTLSDVSFYTTELPEYVLVELLRPFGAGVIHVAAAATYTLLVLTVLALGSALPLAAARWSPLPCSIVAPSLVPRSVAPQSADRGARFGSRGSAAGWLGGLLAAGIMLAPQPGYGAFVLLLSPDHTGTQLPLLLGWLLLDRAPRRWWVPAVLGVLLAAVQLADRVALLTAVLPLALVCAVTVIRAGGGWRSRRYPAALGAAAVASIALSWAAARLLTALGGFTGHPLPFTLAPLGLLWTHTWLTGWGILEVYGANFLGVHGPAGIGFAVLHLAGLALATAATGIALRRFLRDSTGERELVDAVLGVAVVVNLVSYLVSIEPGTVLGTGYDAREIAAVLPLGAVLAGRVLGPVLAARLAVPRPPVLPHTLAPALAVLLAGYAAALGYAAAQPAATGPQEVLASWLTAHGLRYGLAGASANAVTVDSGNRAVVLPTAVRQGRVCSLLYQASAAAYQPAKHDATFLVADAPSTGPGNVPQRIPAAAVRASFGPPAHIDRFHGFTVEVWNVNLLTRLCQ